MNNLKYINKEFDEYRDKVLNISTFTVGIVLLVSFLIILANFPVNITSTIYMRTGGLIVICLLLIFRKKLSNAVKLYTLLFIILVVLISNIWQYGLISSTRLIIFLIPVFVFFIRSYKEALYTLIIYWGTYILFGTLYITHVLDYNFNIHDHVHNLSSWIIDFIAITVGPIAILLLANVYWKSLQKNYQNLEKQHLEIQKTEKALKKSEERLEKVVYATTDGMWDWNLINNKVYYDPRYYELAGYIPNEFPHKIEEFFKRIHPDYAEKVKQVADDYLSGKRDNFLVEFKFERKDGSYMWIMGKGVILDRDENGKPTNFVGTHTNISLRKQAQAELENHKNNLEKIVHERTCELQSINEELSAINEELTQKNMLIGSQKEELEQTIDKLKETQSHLIQSEKMASLGLLTAGVAHEINNPLNYILGGYTGLKRICEDEESKNRDEIKVLLSAIETGVDRASNIVKGLNLFSRTQETYDENCELHSIIDNCLMIMNAQVKHSIQITKNYCKNEFTIQGNTGKLHQLFLNILVNARQSIQGEGYIKITTSSSKENLIIAINDSGCGISEENLSKVMDPFFTTKEVGKGTGLGLSISYTIVQEHKGNLEIKSELGIGTTAIVTFPKPTNNS